MTDQELVRAVAEKVMGWEECALFGSKGMIISRRLANALQRAANTWEPLDDWNDCWMVAEKVGLVALKLYDSGWAATYKSTYRYPIEESFGPCFDPDPRRAILLAALASVENQS